MKESVVLVMCGSFNPVTNMHLRMMEIARDHLQHCGYVVLGGFISPVHDSYPKDTLISITHRIAMLKFALDSSDWLQLSTWESQQDRWIETYDVLHYHQEKIHEFMKPKNINRFDKNKNDVNQNVSRDVTVKLVCGADFLASFLVPNLWKAEHIELILQNYGIAVITRIGYNISKIIEEHDILFKFMPQITIVNEFIENAISSTKIRRACSRNQSIKYLVEDKVERYIKTHKLYTDIKLKCKSIKNGPGKSANLVNNILNNPMELTKVTVASSKKKLSNAILRSKRKSEGLTRVSRRLKRNNKRISK